MSDKTQCDSCGIYFTAEDDHDFFRVKNSAFPQKLFRFCDTSCLLKTCIKEFLSKNNREIMNRLMKNGLRRIEQCSGMSFVYDSEVFIYIDYAYAKKNVRAKIKTVSELIDWCQVHEFRCKNFDESDFALACDICESAYRPDLDQPPAIIVKTSPDAMNSINVNVRTNIATPDLVPAMLQTSNFRLVCAAKCLKKLLENPFKYHLLGANGSTCKICKKKTERFFHLTIGDKKVLLCSINCVNDYFTQ